MDFNLDKISAIKELTEGVHPLEILKVEEIISKNGSYYLKFDYKVLDADYTIKYDNCVITKNDGNQSRLGLAKLSKILKATGIDLKGQTNGKIVCQLLSDRGLKFKARIAKDGDYYKIDSSDMSFSHIESLTEVAEKSPEHFMKEDNQNIDITVTSKW